MRPPFGDIRFEVMRSIRPGRMILCCASAPCYTVLMNTDVILFDPAGRLQWAESIYTLSTPRAMTETPVAAVRLRLDALARVHLDDRLSLLQTGEWGFDTDHIRQVNRVLDDFLNLPSRRKDPATRG